MRFCIVYPRFSIILVHINKDDCGLTKFYHFIGFKRYIQVLLYIIYTVYTFLQLITPRTVNKK